MASSAAQTIGFAALLDQLEHAANGVHDINVSPTRVITLTGVNVNTLQVSDFVVHQ